jgi:hypothetical protein
MEFDGDVDRRTLLAGALGTVGLAVAGCSRPTPELRGTTKPSPVITSVRPRPHPSTAPKPASVREIIKRATLLSPAAQLDQQRQPVQPGQSDLPTEELSRTPRRAGRERMDHHQSRPIPSPPQHRRSPAANAHHAELRRRDRRPGSRAPRTADAARHDWHLLRHDCGAGQTKVDEHPRHPPASRRRHDPSVRTPGTTML